MRRSWRSFGLACMKAWKAPWGSTTQVVKWSKVRPRSDSTAAVSSSAVPASVTVSAVVTRSSRASLVVAPVLVRRTTRTAR